MRKKLLSKLMLLLCALLVGSMSAWADDLEWSLNDLYQNGTKVTEKTIISTSGGTLSFTDKDKNFSILLTRNSSNQPGFYTSSGYFRFYSSDTFKLSAADGITITKIVVTPNGSNFSLSSLDGLDASKKTWTGSASEVTFTGAGTNKWDKITITYSTSSGGESEKEDCDLTLTGAPVELEFDLYDDANAKVINYTTSSTGAVTVSESEYIDAEVGNGTITVIPKKKTNDAVEITVNQAADDDYKAGSVTFTVTVTDSTPKTGAWVLTDLADLAEGDVFVIVGNNGKTYAMSNNKGTGSAPAAVSVDIEDDEITSDVDDNIKWNISGNATDGYTFYPDGDDQTWLYCTNSNNGVRVGTNNAKTFVIDSDYLKHSETSRYVGIYNSQDWRCYTNTTGNIANQTFAFYKYVDGTTPQKADPELSFSSETAEATFGQDFTAPTLNTASGFDGTVEYTSSVETVAQVMDIETGELRIVGGGTTVITATFAGNDTYKKGSASYTLTVTDNRVATTISQENITIDLTEVATLTQLTPVVKDANENVVAYTNSPTAEGLPEVYFETVSDENGIFGSFDSHGNVVLNNVTGTATVKAVYNHFQLNPDYRPSECTFTITIYQPLNGIAEFCNLTSGASGTLKLTDAVVLYVNGNDMFVRDNTGAIDFYNTGLTYEAGNILNGKINAKYTLYSGMHELTTPISNNTLVATAGSAVTPTEITTSDAADNACNLVRLSGVTVSSSNNKFYVDDVQVYDKFKLNYSIEEGKTYDIVGIMVPYNSFYEICPTEAPVEIVVATPTITLEQYEYNLNANGGDAELTVTCENMPDDPQLAVVFCDANGDAVADDTYDWITASINNSGNIAGHIDANTSDDRTAYFKVSGVDTNNNTVYSALVTINQAAPAEPNITFETASIDFAFGGESDRKLSFEYESLGNNPTFEVVFFEQDGETTATYDWVTSATIEDNKVNLSVEANDGEARTAYFKVRAQGTEIYSNLVTITQAAYVIDYAMLPFYWAGGTKSDFLDLNGVTANGLGTDYAASNAPYRIKLDSDGDYIQVKTDCQPVLVSVDVKMIGGGDTSKITIQESTDGETFTDVEVLTIEGKQNTFLYLQTANAFDADTRYVRLYFTKGSNVGVGGITIEKDNEVATVGEAGYATYVTKHNVSFPEGVTAYIVTSIESTYVQMEEVASAPKGTPVILKGEGTHQLAPAASTADVNGNQLKVSDGTVKGDGTIYALANKTDGVGFYRVKEDITVPAGKAYLEVATSNDVREFLAFTEGETDGIQTLSDSPLKGENIYSLSGQRVQKAQKGIYIVNGKKIMVK